MKQNGDNEAEYTKHNTNRGTLRYLVIKQVVYFVLVY
jgi:hypothetical protein